MKQVSGVCVKTRIQMGGQVAIVQLSARYHAKFHKKWLNLLVFKLSVFYSTGLSGVVTNLHVQFLYMLVLHCPSVFIHKAETTLDFKRKQKRRNQRSRYALIRRNIHLVMFEAIIMIWTLWAQLSRNSLKSVGTWCPPPTHTPLPFRPMSIAFRCPWKVHGPHAPAALRKGSCLEVVN